MSQRSKTVVVALTTSGISLVAGAYTGYILTKNYLTEKYEVLIEEQVVKAKVFYSERYKTGEFADPVALAEKLVGDVDEEGEDPVETTEEDDDYIVVDGKPFRDTMSPDERTNYNKISENYTGPAIERQTYIQDPVMPEKDETMASFEQRLADAAHERVNAIIERVGADDVVEKEDLVVSNIFETNGVEPLVHNNRGEGGAYIISSQEYMEAELGYSQNTITYYQGDDTLVDERDQPIPDKPYVIGENNLQFGNGSGDPNLVYIRNDELEVDFEICLSDGTYKEEVLGISPPSGRR